MRTFSFLLIALGVASVGINGYDEYRSRFDPRDQQVLVGDYLISNKSGRSLRDAMAVQWFGSVCLLGSGIAVYLVWRRQERLDPLSPEFDWKGDDS